MFDNQVCNLLHPYWGPLHLYLLDLSPTLSYNYIHTTRNVQRNSTKYFYLLNLESMLQTSIDLVDCPSKENSTDHYEITILRELNNTSDFSFQKFIWSATLIQCWLPFNIFFFLILLIGKDNSRNTGLDATAQMQEALKNILKIF